MGLITIKDIDKAETHPQRGARTSTAACASAPRSASATIATRASQALVDAGVDVIVVDTAHGHSQRRDRRGARHQEALPGRRSSSPATSRPPKPTAALIDAGADAVKVGIGPGSICTTRVVAGVGVPQITAIAECARAAEKHGMPIIADGGIKYSGDVAKAIAAGAHTVMIGSLFAGTDEAPGESSSTRAAATRRTAAWARSARCRRARKDRYFQARGDGRRGRSSCPRASRGACRTSGSLARSIYQLIGGLRSGMGYTGSQHHRGAAHERARSSRITVAGLREIHVHDVIITKEAPNYRQERE